MSTLKVLHLLLGRTKLSKVLEGQRVRLLEDVLGMPSLHKGRLGTIRPCYSLHPFDLLVAWDEDGRELLVSVEEVELVDMGEGP